GFMKDQTHRDFTDDDLETISSTYHNWRKRENYKNIPAFCKSSSIDDVIKHGYVLTPGRYVGSIAEEVDVIPFDLHLSVLSDFLKCNTQKEQELDEISQVVL